MPLPFPLPFPHHDRLTPPPAAAATASAAAAQGCQHKHKHHHHWHDDGVKKASAFRLGAGAPITPHLRPAQALGGLLAAAARGRGRGGKDVSTATLPTTTTFFVAGTLLSSCFSSRFPHVQVASTPPSSFLPSSPPLSFPPRLARPGPPSGPHRRHLQEDADRPACPPATPWAPCGLPPPDPCL